MQSVFINRLTPHLHQSRPHAKDFRIALRSSQRACMTSTDRHKVSYDAIRCAEGHQGRCLGALLGCFSGDSLGNKSHRQRWGLKSCHTVQMMFSCLINDPRACCHCSQAACMLYTTTGMLQELLLRAGPGSTLPRSRSGSSIWQAGATQMTHR